MNQYGQKKRYMCLEIRAQFTKYLTIYRMIIVSLS